MTGSTVALLPFLLQIEKLFIRLRETCSREARVTRMREEGHTWTTRKSTLLRKKYRTFPFILMRSDGASACQSDSTADEERTPAT